MGKYNLSLPRLYGAADVAREMGPGYLQPMRPADRETENKGLIIPVTGTIMDELGKWFLGILTSVNKGSRLGPQVASYKRAEAFLEQVGGEGALKLAALFKIGNAELVSRLAIARPDMGEWLAGDEPQKALDRYFAERREVFDSYRKFFTRGLSLAEGSIKLSFAEPGGSESAGSEAWEKVFEILTGGENDGQESSGL